MPEAIQSKSRLSLRSSRRLENSTDATRFWLGLELQNGTQILAQSWSRPYILIQPPKFWLPPPQKPKNLPGVGRRSRFRKLVEWRWRGSRSCLVSNSARIGPVRPFPKCSDARGFESITRQWASSSRPSFDLKDHRYVLVHRERTGWLARGGSRLFHGRVTAQHSPTRS